jgi:hypothetical protein
MVEMVGLVLSDYLGGCVLRGSPRTIYQNKRKGDPLISN